MILDTASIGEIRSSLGFGMSHHILKTSVENIVQKLLYIFQK